jgi:hypothetical protein
MPRLLAGWMGDLDAEREALANPALDEESRDQFARTLAARA